MLKKFLLSIIISGIVLLVTLFVLANFLPRLITSGSRPNCKSSDTRKSTSSSVTPCSSKILVFSKTAAFRHASIRDAKVALQKLAMQHQIAVDFTEDSTAFTDVNLKQYAAVVFLMTTGTVLDGDQKAAFERYIRAGGGYVGVHSASDTEYEWPWYGKLVGAYFDRIHGHSRVTQATLDVIDRTSSSTNMLPLQWVRTDEWYNFATNPRTNGVHVLLTLDESTYNGGVMGADHPIAWYHQYDGGRSWYTAMGHTPESYSEPLFLAHLWGGIAYAARL